MFIKVFGGEVKGEEPLPPFTFQWVDEFTLINGARMGG